MIEVIGMATTNTGCKDVFPTVFVRISKSLDWIESIAWPNEVPSEHTTKTQVLIIAVPTTKAPPQGNSSISFHFINQGSKESRIILISIVGVLAIIVMMACVGIVVFKMCQSKGQGVNVNIQMR